MLMGFLSAVVTMVTVSSSTSTASLCKCFQQCCGNYCGKVLLCLLLVTVCYSTNTGMKDKRKCHRGTISPREPYFLEGEDIDLICNRKKGRAKHLTFVRGRNSEEVPRKYITKINGTAIQLKIPNITAEDIDALEYNIQYRCVDRRKHSKCFDNVYVQLEYALRKPENLQCRDYNFNKMKCTWSHGVEYHLPHDMNITCEYRLDKTEVLYHTFGGLWMSCENLTSTSCYWDAKNYPAPESTIDVRVSVTNTIRNVTKTITQTFYKYDIVEPGPVTILQERLDISKPRCVELTLEPPISTRSFEFIVTYESYESNCSSQQVKSVLYDGGNESSKITMEICDLVPKTEYKFSVKGHVIRKESNGTFTGWGHWSKPNFLHIITKEDVPDINPETIPGLYELSNSTSQMSEEDDYSLRIYWVPQNECQLHDLADHVTYTISTSKRSKQVNHPEFMAEMKVPKQKVFNVTLQAANSVGFSSSSSVITVYQSSMMGLRGSKLIIQYNKTSENCVTYADIEIVETSSDFTDLNHTLVWCEGKHLCEKAVEWRKLENKTSFVFPGDLCKIDYRYGLVTHGYHRGQGQKVNTGIQWETCTYQSGNVPDKPLQNFKVGSQREKEFVVEWTPDDCKATEAYILKYMVSYCKTDRKDRCDCKYENRYVSRETRSYKVTDLQAGSHYCVQVRAVSKAGLGPVNSSTVLIETGDTDFAQVIIGCVAGVCLVLALSVIIFCTRKWCKKTKTKFSVKVPEVEIENNILTNSKTLNNGSDSGSEYIYNTSGGTEETNLEEQQFLVDEEYDIDGYKDPRDVDPFDTGYQEESVPEQISESSPMLSSADSGEKSFRKVQKLQTPESHVDYNVSAINEKHYSANNSNSANKHEIINIEEDGVFDEDVRVNEDLEMLCMSLKHNNLQTTDNSVSAESDEISLNEFIEQREESGEIYQDLHSGSTVSDESDMEDIETELNENLSPEKEINSLELPQSNKTNIDTEMSDNSDDLAQNGTCQSPVIQKCAINDQKDFEQSNTANGILESKFSQSYFTSFLDTDSDVECIEDIEVDTVDNIGGYKGTDDVGVEVSDSECERESDEDSEINFGYDMGGYKKSEEVEGMSEHSSEEELENDNVLEEAASQNEPTDSVEISEVPDKKDDLLVNKNGIVRNGFIPKLSDTDKIRNNSLSGSDNSLASTAGSSHGNSSSAVSYVKAGAGDELNVKEDEESGVRDLKSFKVDLKNHTENDRKKTELISDIPALEN